MATIDDEQDDTHKLPDWATLTEVSTTLGVSRNAVQSAARRAFKRHELWVKKAHGNILIDTQNETFNCLVRRWKEPREGAEPNIADNPWASLIDPIETTFYSWYPSLATQGSEYWPAFCHWLADQGLEIFFNLLEDKQTHQLRWQWGDLHDEKRYPNLKEALIAALQCQLNMRSSAEEHALLSLPLPPPQEEPPRRWRFRKGTREHE